jgi:hypothetical protein
VNEFPPSSVAFAHFRLRTDTSSGTGVQLGSGASQKRGPINQSKRRTLRSMPGEPPRLFDRAPGNVLTTLVMLVVLLAFGASAHAAGQTYLTQETLSVSLYGHEEWTTLSLKLNEVYLATVEGAIEVDKDPGIIFSGPKGYLDARYLTDDAMNFTQRGLELTFSQSIYHRSARLISEDFPGHRYVYQIIGNGERISVKFKNPRQLRLEGGSFQVQIAYSRPPTITELFLDAICSPAGLIADALLMSAVGGIFWTLTDTEEAKAERRERRARQRELRARRFAEEEHWRHSEEERWRSAQLAESENQQRAREEEAWRPRVAALEFDYRYELFEDAKWLDDYARKNKDKLLARAKEIREQDRDFHKDAAFIQRLKVECPHLYRRSIWESEVLMRAVRFDVETPPPKTKKNPEEFRAAMAKRESIRMEDAMVRGRTRVEAVFNLRKMLDEYDLDPDERQGWEQRLLDEYLNDDNHDGGKTV